ncbi:Mss4-like protein [Kalaharituber pfeilii]|nr:Mss4-like protein [Kalaharituber pfeilii]
MTRVVLINHLGASLGAFRAHLQYSHWTPLSDPHPQKPHANSFTASQGPTFHTQTDHPNMTDNTPKPYYGSCHCGALKYTFTTTGNPLTWTITRCNCSICHKGALTVYGLPVEDQPSFVLTSTTEPSELKAYMIPGGKLGLKHYFCGRCGCRTHTQGIVDGKGIFAVIVTSLDDVDLSMVKPRYWDIRNEQWDKEPQERPIAPGLP